MLHEVGIAPEFFEMVEFAGFRQHHMNYNVHVIDQYPLFGLAALMFERQLFAVLFHQVLHIVGNGFQLIRVGSFTDDKEIGYGLRYLSKIQAHNIVAFFLVDGGDDRLEDLAVAVEPGDAFFPAV